MLRLWLCPPTIWLLALEIHFHSMMLKPSEALRYLQPLAACERPGGASKTASPISLSALGYGDDWGDRLCMMMRDSLAAMVVAFHVPSFRMACSSKHAIDSKVQCFAVKCSGEDSTMLCFSTVAADTDRPMEMCITAQRTCP